MRSTFATFGIPKTLVPDNDSHFISSAFKEFLKANGIHHIKTAPASKGLAKRAIQTLKTEVQKFTDGGLE